MDKEFLIRVNDSLKKVKTQILLNEKIRTMLYFDNIDEDTIAPSIEQVADHIFIQPIIKVETTEPFNKKNYITITVPESGRSVNKMEYTFRIIVMCDKSCWDLNGDIRPLLISQEIVNIFENFKLELSNTMQFNSLVETVTNEDVYGYSILFEVSDGISDLNDE